jgi:hypothetical protein
MCTSTNSDKLTASVILTVDEIYWLLSGITLSPMGLVIREKLRVALRRAYEEHMR